MGKHLPLVGYMLFWQFHPFGLPPFFAGTFLSEPVVSTPPDPKNLKYTLKIFSKKEKIKENSVTENFITF